ncbi:MAG: hypothetical protein DRP19_05435, partial [Thermotogae bacterium]
MLSKKNNDEEAVSLAGKGYIVRVIGPIVDVKFAEKDLPDIYNALEVINPETQDKLIMEAEQLIGDDTVRAIA